MDLAGVLPPVGQIVEKWRFLAVQHAAGPSIQALPLQDPPYLSTTTQVIENSQLFNHL